MKQEIITKTPPFKEGVDIPANEAIEVWNFLVSKGNEHLENTAFVKGRIFKESDIEAMKRYYQEVLEYQEEKFGEKGAVFNRSLREHLGLAERLGELAAPLLGIDKYLMQAVMLTHDLGRLMSHRRGRNNAIEVALTKKLGFSEEFINLLPPDTLWTSTEETALQEQLEEMTANNNGIVGAVELLDVLAKWKDSNQMRRMEDIILKATSAQHEPNQSQMWPSEYKRQVKVGAKIKNDLISVKYDFLGKWFQKKTGMSVNEFMEIADKSLRDAPIPDDWV